MDASGVIVVIIIVVGISFIVIVRDSILAGIIVIRRFDRIVNFRIIGIRVIIDIVKLGLGDADGGKDDESDQR
jgi:hypothetical protein